MQIDFLRVVLEAVHQPGSVPLHLLGGRDRQEDYLSELLGVERPEDAAAQDLGPLVLLLLDDDHCFVDAVHDQPYDVGPRHAGQLLCDDVFQVNQVPHALKGSVPR